MTPITHARMRIMRTKSQVETPGVAGTVSGTAAAAGTPVTVFPSGIFDSSKAAAEDGVAGCPGPLPADL